ncbi:MAG: hypothetical protein Q7R49_00820 [Candidatus Daviesbacteria bacterium]|nr:hypothetical protein [Candidatus Daviesbacteria bacterium]
MNYDTQLINLKTLLPQARNILIALPQGSDIDKLASGLALYLSLTQAGKNVSVVCEDTILVGQAHLFAIDKVSQSLPASNAGDFIVTLTGVAENGVVPSLEKEDYFVEGNNLNLVFKVLPGKTFQPTGMSSRYSGGGIDVIFVIGAPQLANLGSAYQTNPSVFTSGHLVNIDDNQTNTNYGMTNVVEPNASSLSEMVTFTLTTLGLPLAEDIATNLLTGIFDVTGHLTSTKVGADTYLAISNCLKSGGVRPGATIPAQVVPTQPVQPRPVAPSPTYPGASTGPSFDLSALMPQTDNFTVPPVVSSGPKEQAPVLSQNMPSPEERPMEEGVVTEAEPDWLTPKIFKGSSIG